MRFKLFFVLLMGTFLVFSHAVFAARIHHAPTFRHHQTEQNEGAAPQKSQTDVREVKNGFFSIVLPEGWRLQRPVRPVGDRVSAHFIKNNAVQVNLNMFKIPFTAKLMAEKTAADMRKRGMEVSEPIEKDGLYMVDISKKGVRGQGWFGANGSTGASTVIFAPDLKEANELLQAFKPAIPGLVPQSVE